MKRGLNDGTTKYDTIRHDESKNQEKNIKSSRQFAHETIYKMRKLPHLAQNICMVAC